MIKSMSKKKASIAVITVILVLGSVWLYAQQSKPSIIWTPKQVVEIVQSNTTKTVNVSFKANTNLNNVTFFVTPALKNVVSVNPTSFTSISANRSYTVVLTINSGPTAQVKYQGTVQLKDSMNFATNALPLPVTVVVHNEPVPPDPGEAGKQTLEGIDFDNDGVRDDIQRYIVLNYFDSLAEVAGLRQYAKATQRSLLNANSGDRSLVVDNVQKEFDAGKCLAHVMELYPSFEATDKLQVEMLNTRQRSLANIRVESYLGGHVFPGAPSTQYKFFCEFNPDTIGR